MFSSIRSRLWLTYAITIISALLVIAFIFIIYLVSNPLIYRETRLRLGVVEAQLLAKQKSWANLPPDQLQSALVNFDKDFDARLLVLNSSRVILADSRSASAPTLETRALLRLFRVNPNSITDSQGQAWLLVSHPMTNGNYLVTAFPRPKISLINIVTDELVPPLLWGGSLALALALFIAFWMAKWVADPLQEVIDATKSFSGSQTSRLEIKGPNEVQELVGAYNQMTARVEASQKAQRDFVANVSHELKTPLTSIQGFTQALMDGTAETLEEQKYAFKIIYNESGRMNRLVLDLLDLARLDADIADFRQSRVDILPVLQTVVERFDQQVSQSGVNLILVPAHLPNIVGDGDRLAQVFSNLVDNALKFTHPGGSITLSSKVIGDFVEISVSDTGIGIAESELKHIFDRFYQIDASRKGGEKHGAGLGLAIARDIVKKHGGRINVTSQLGNGSEFVVSLPIAITNRGTTSDNASKLNKTQSK